MFLGASELHHRCLKGFQGCVCVCVSITGTPILQRGEERKLRASHPTLVGLGWVKPSRATLGDVEESQAETGPLAVTPGVHRHFFKIKKKEKKGRILLESQGPIFMNAFRKKVKNQTKHLSKYNTPTLVP